MNVIQARYFQKASKTCSFESFTTKTEFELSAHLRDGMVLEVVGAVLVTGKDTRLSHNVLNRERFQITPFPKVARIGLCSRTSEDMTNPFHVKVLKDTS